MLVDTEVGLSPLRFTVTYYGLAPAPNIEPVAAVATEVAASFDRKS